MPICVHNAEYSKIPFQEQLINLEVILVSCFRSSLCNNHVDEFICSLKDDKLLIWKTAPWTDREQFSFILQQKCLVFISVQNEDDWSDPYVYKQDLSDWAKAEPISTTPPPSTYGYVLIYIFIRFMLNLRYWWLHFKFLQLSALCLIHQ